MLVDAIPALMNQVGKTLGKRIARQSNLDLTLGDGDAKPNGVVTQSQLGHTTSDTTITYNDLLELQHSVDPAYWSRSTFMMAPATFKVVRQLRDADGNRAYERGLLFDRPISLNTAMPAIAPESKPVIFGDLSQYVVRETGSLQLLRYAEKFAEFGQTGLAAVLRLDGALAVRSSIKHLQMAD